MKEYIVQSKNDKGTIQSIAHSICKNTGGLFCKFIDKKKAEDLLNKEKEISPEYQYRILTITKTHKCSDWE